MKKYKKTTKEVEETEDVICDSCGDSCYNGENFEFLTLSNRWGYGSKYDLQTWEAHVCERCVDEKLIFINFKSTPYIV